MEALYLPVGGAVQWWSIRDANTKVVGQHRCNCKRIQRWFVVAVYHLGSWEEIHELKQRWLQVLNGLRANGLYDGKFGKLVDTSEEEFFCE